MMNMGLISGEQPTEAVLVLKSDFVPGRELRIPIDFGTNEDLASRRREALSKALRMCGSADRGDSIADYLQRIARGWEDILKRERLVGRHIRVERIRRSKSGKAVRVKFEAREGALRDSLAYSDDLTITTWVPLSAVVLHERHSYVPLYLANKMATKENEKLRAVGDVFLPATLEALSGQLKAPPGADKWFSEHKAAREQRRLEQEKVLQERLSEERDAQLRESAARAKAVSEGEVATQRRIQSRQWSDCLDIEVVDWTRKGGRYAKATSIHRGVRIAITAKRTYILTREGKEYFKKPDNVKVL